VGRGAIFVGTAGVLPAHAHQAIQICFLFEGRIRLRPSDEDQWLDCDLGIVPSQHTHGIANLDRAPVDSIVRELRAAVRERRGRAAIVALARRLVQQLTQHSEPAVTSDERIVRAVTYVNDHLSAPLTLKQVAGVAHLSPSRFRHLFAPAGPTKRGSPSAAALATSFGQ
jgi:AraC family transcriptional regulator